MEQFHAYRRDLPHWREDESTYFLTWRLAARKPPLEPSERSTVMAALEHFNELRYLLLAFVVMDDHVHALLQSFMGFPPEKLVHSWKSFSGARLTEAGRTGPVWQREYMDRIVRNERELWHIAQYIFANPEQRWPGTGNYPWMGGALMPQFVGMR